VIVGLTGGIATGKSTVTDMFRELGAYVVDADVWARRIVEPGSEALSEIVQAFGEDVLLPDGTLNRPKLGSLIFHNPDMRQQLNEITHPRVRAGMREETEEALRTEPLRPILWDVPLLFEGETLLMVDKTLVVYVDEALQLARLMHRNHLSEEEAMARIRSQLSIEDKKGRADYVIDNRGTLEETREQVQRVWRTIEGEAKGRAL
jgi:dephospho-CoA kinase